MTTRFELGKVEPAALQAMMGLEGYVRNSGLDPTLIEE